MARDMMEDEMGEENEMGEAKGGDEITSLIGNITQGIAMLTEVVTSSGVAPQIGEKLQAIQSELAAVVDEMAGMKAGGKRPAASSPVAMEAGAGGVPMSPASR